MQKQQEKRVFYLPSLPRSFWYSLAFAVIFFALSALWFLFNQNVSQVIASSSGNIDAALAGFISFPLSWIGVKRSFWKRDAHSAHLSLERRLHFWIPLVFSLALLSEGLGNSIFAYQAWYPPPASSPYTWGDLAILSMYPALLIGILLLPRDTLSGKAPLRFLMDSLILIVTIAIFSWYFTLGPVLLQSQGGPVLDVAYPTSDLLVISFLILLSRSVADRGLRIAIRVLSSALVIFVVADSLLAYQSVQNTVTNWPIIAHGVGCFVIALSLQAMRWLSPKATTQGAATSEIPLLLATQLWKLFLPYALIPAAIGLVIFIWATHQSGPLATGTYWCGLVLLSLIFIKQFLAIREIHWLNQGLQRTQGALHEKNAALGQANAHLEALATTDPLTELPNHRALLETLEKEVERARRYGHPLSILFFDGDHFKRVNDTYGHSVGDAVLHELGSRGKSVLRGGDTLGRYGGEEFMVLLPETGLTLACEVAERLRVAIATYPLATGLIEGGLHVTISIGVATFPVDGQTGSEVVEKADQAMYWSKRLGRNQIRTVVEAGRAAADSALVATISNLQRSDGGQGQNIEQIMRDQQLGTIHSLMWLLELRDQGISAHSYQVSDLAGAIAQELGLEQTEVFAVSTAGLLHDIGKIAIPDHLLQKEGPLSASERTLIQQHPDLGAQILEVSPYLQIVMPAVRHHHENWDGTGYPYALKEEDIPLAARIIRVSEAYQAMMSSRPYQAQRSAVAARSELERCSGTCFDPTVVEVALRVLVRQEEEVLEGTAVRHIS